MKKRPPYKRKSTYVTAFCHDSSYLRDKPLYNKERFAVIKQLAELKKRIVIIVPEKVDPKSNSLLEALSKYKNIRIKKMGPRSGYYSAWQRDQFTKIRKQRYLNKASAGDYWVRESKHQNRHFGEGGRVINMGGKGNTKTLIISRSQKYSDRNQRIQREIDEEVDMLKKQGHKVFTLPGGRFVPKDKNGEKGFFTHLDVFINAIPQKKLLVVDPEYYEKNKREINNISKQTNFKVITVHESEKHSYPANFLILDSGEVIVNSDAKKTINKLRKEGVNVLISPKPIRENLNSWGGIGCFVNVD